MVLWKSVVFPYMDYCSLMLATVYKAAKIIELGAPQRSFNKRVATHHTLNYCNIEVFEPALH